MRYTETVVPRRPMRYSKRPPNLFGAYKRMPLLIAMIQNADFIRRSDIVKRTGRQAVDQVEISDKAGLLLPPWRYKNIYYMMALNPRFPLIREFKALLKELSRQYPSALAGVVPTVDRRLPKRLPRRKIALDYLLGSPVRTQTLAVLEALGGRTWQSNVHRGVPGQFMSAVKTVVNFFIAEGVLEKRGVTIAFSKRAWIPALRRLLRAYLKKQTDFSAALDVQARKYSERRQGYRKLHLLAPPSTQRALVALAVNGPMRASRLLASATANSDKTIAIWQREGILANRKVGHSRLISLNSSYPAYRELRALLLSIGDVESTSHRRDLSEERAIFSAERLFASRLRSETMIMLGACRNGEIDVASLGRLLPQYEVSSLRKALRKYEVDGIVRSRVWKGLKLYSLDPGYPHWHALKRLLDAVTLRWPHYRTVADVEERLFSRERAARQGRPAPERRLGRRRVRGA
jgi:hypothetical protein